MARRSKNVRAKILALLNREREVYNRKTREYDRAPVRMGDVAKKLGVSVRTIRRWKNEGAEPSARVSKSALEKLSRAASNAERATARELERDRKKHRGAVKLDKSTLPVMPTAHRRKLKQYKRAGGRVVESGEVYESSWLNYNVQGWTFKEAAALLVQIWRAGKPFQFIYEVPAGGQLPRSGSKPPRTVRQTTRAATAPINPEWFEDEAELISRLNQYMDIEQGSKSRRLLYIAVDDQGK